MFLILPLIVFWGNNTCCRLFPWNKSTTFEEILKICSGFKIEQFLVVLFSLLSGQSTGGSSSVILRLLCDVPVFTCGCLPRRAEENAPGSRFVANPVVCVLYSANGAVGFSLLSEGEKQQLNVNMRLVQYDILGAVYRGRLSSPGLSLTGVHAAAYCGGSLYGLIKKKR